MIVDRTMPRRITTMPRKGAVPTKQEFAAKVGAQMKAIRKAANMRLEDVENATDGAVKVTVLSQYENGELVPGMVRYLLICAALRCSLTDLLPVEVRAALSSPARLARIIK
jgi:transcriptional regulator with XRE-family HTH domain